MRLAGGGSCSLPPPPTQKGDIPTNPLTLSPYKHKNERFEFLDIDEGEVKVQIEKCRDTSDDCCQGAEKRRVSESGGAIFLWRETRTCHLTRLTPLQILPNLPNLLNTRCYLEVPPACCMLSRLDSGHWQLYGATVWIGGGASTALRLLHIPVWTHRRWKATRWEEENEWGQSEVRNVESTGIRNAADLVAPPTSKQDPHSHSPPPPL